MKPDQILTDRGSQFYPARGGRSEFTEFCSGNGIEHIVASVRRPSTIGKIEAFHKAYVCESWMFPSHRGFIHYWNYERLHQGIRYLYPAYVYFHDICGWLEQQLLSAKVIYVQESPLRVASLGGVYVSEQQVDTGLGLMGVDWEERIDYARMRKERLEKAKQAVARSGADALFLFRWENVRYVTSLRTHMWPVMFWGLASAILPNGAEPQLYTMDVDHVKARMPWIKDTVKEFAGGGLEVFAGAKAWAEDAKQVLKDTKVEPKVIGVDAWNPPLLEALPKVFPNTRFVDGQKIILEARAVKTKDEINCLKNAMSLTVSGFGAGVEFLRPGRKECEVLAECFRAMYANGGEWTQCSNIVCSGPYLAPYRRFTSDRIIDHGDMVVFDIGSCFNGYWGDFTRTFICGKDAQPTKEQVRVHMNAYNAMLAAIKKIRPGGSTKEVYEAAEPWILGGLLGHGLGLGSAEPPFIVEQSKQEPMELKPGMVFSIEPYAGVPGVGGVRLEHNVLCTETGYEIIDKFPFEQRLME